MRYHTKVYRSRIDPQRASDRGVCLLQNCRQFDSYRAEGFIENECCLAILDIMSFCSHALQAVSMKNKMVDLHVSLHVLKEDILVLYAAFAGGAVANYFPVRPSQS